MIQDLHSHTYYSFCGQDKPEAVVEAAIAGGIDLLGFTDHNYGVGFGNAAVFFSGLPLPLSYANRMLERYFDHITLIRGRYADRIRILRGIEVCTLNGPGHERLPLPEDVNISFFDFCLLEHIDQPDTVAADLFAYAKRIKCPAVGLAHTDLFAYIGKIGADPYDYLCRMADAGIFWEMNVSYDSIHNYRIHPYLIDFFEDEKKQELVDLFNAGLKNIKESGKYDEILEKYLG